MQDQFIALYEFNDADAAGSWAGHLPTRWAGFSGGRWYGLSIGEVSAPQPAGPAHTVFETAVDGALSQQALLPMFDDQIVRDVYTGVKTHGTTRLTQWLSPHHHRAPLSDIDWRIGLGQRFEAILVWGTGDDVGHIVAKRWYHADDLVFDANDNLVPLNGYDDPTSEHSLCVWEDVYEYTEEDPRTGPRRRTHTVRVYNTDGSVYAEYSRPKAYDTRAARVAGERRRTNVANLVEDSALFAIVAYQIATSDPQGMDPSVRAGALLVSGTNVGGPFFTVQDGLNAFVKAGDPTLLFGLLDYALATGQHDWLTADVVAQLKAPLTRWLPA
jgi:hypothetical protein